MPEQVKFALFNVTPTNYQDHYRLLYDKITAIQKRHPTLTEDRLWCHEECDSNLTRFESFMNARAICLQTNVTGRDLRMLMFYFQGIFDENQYISLTSDDDDDDDDDVGDNVVVAREDVGVIFTVNDLIEYLRYGLVYGRFRPLRRRRHAGSDDSRSEGDYQIE